VSRPGNRDRKAACRSAIRRRFREAKSAGCSTGSPASTDLMNSAMTAGLHHQWRQPGGSSGLGFGPGLRRRSMSACGTGGPRPPSCAGRSGRTAASSGATFSEPMLEAGAPQERRRGDCRFEFGWADALELPYGGRQASMRSRSASGARNPRRTWPRGLSEMARVLRPGGTPRDSWRSRGRSGGAPVELLLALVRPALVPMIGTAGRRLRRPTATSPDSVSHFSQSRSGSRR